MRRFSEEYLSETRTGMWGDRDALSGLALATRERVLDVGAGTGEFTRVLREEVSGGDPGALVTAVDADPDLLGAVSPPRLLGDATRLPVQANTVDLAVCQALLVNLDDPARALEELARVSTDRVAVVEPDNSAVTVESTVGDETALARRARGLYIRGSTVNPALGSARDLFEQAELAAVTVRRHNHVRTVEPPYSEQALESARRKASGAGIETDRETLLAAGLNPEAFDHLRGEWRAMGRQVVEQMADSEYRRRETVPFYVTAGRV
ncbi:MAG: methylase involved in ubiquinone/menaquinone biosynthesis [halophilic archaeon J07HX64]|jgi:Methylase involved in ubiquinone/menaquinone biosynthesis|nr:MAG: methylase involved in ubiquinone/menaquinone biosynthesis [halophilic archaeon J07HX64]